MKKIKDIMTSNDLKHCSLETKLQDVAKIMKDFNYGALPVIDKDKNVISIVTDRDICLCLVTRKEKKISELTVQDAITTLKIHTVKVEDNITKALQKMRKNKIGRLPVTDKEGKIKGMISMNNLLSDSLINKEELGKTTSEDENLAKTLKALYDRDYSNPIQQELRQLETVIL